MQFLIKTVISALIIAAIAIVSKKYSIIGAIIASLPITSILAMIWLYNDTKDIGKVIDLSNAIALIVVPSLIFFLVLPIFLKNNINFYLSILGSSLIMILFYYLYICILRYFNVDI